MNKPLAAEKHVEDKIKRSLHQANVYYYKNFASGFTNKGIPDIVGCSNQGKFFAIEVKRIKGGKPTPVQIKNLALIAKNNGRPFLSCSKDVVIMLDLKWIQLKKLADNGLLKVIPIKYQPDLNLKMSAKKAKDIWQHRPDNCNDELFVSPKNYKKYFL